MDLSRATSRIVGIGARKQSTPQYGARVPHRVRRDCIMVAVASESQERFVACSFHNFMRSHRCREP